MDNNELKDIQIGKVTANDILNRFTRINNYLLESQANSDILLTKDVFNNISDLEFFLNCIYNSFGVEALDEFQADYTKKVILALKEKIPYEEVQLNISKDKLGYLYIMVSTIIDGITYPMISINHYLKEIHIIENTLINDSLKNIEKSNAKIIELKDYLKELELAKNNPLYLSDDNYFKMMLFIVSKKKLALKVKEEVSKTLDLISQEQYNISFLRIQLEEMDLNNNKVILLTEKYIERLINYFNFKVIKQTENTIEAVDDELEEIKLHNIKHSKISL